ncbi:MAG: triose-phosphate isomerase [Pseudohongiellaceae bacterium]
MRQRLVAGNWKMHGTRLTVTTLLKELDASAAVISVASEVVICPACIHIPLAEHILRNSSIKVGAQNAYHEPQGAFTGEVAASMLAEHSVRYVIVGHSERRHVFGEKDATVSAKFVAVQSQGMIPILCLGETLKQREGGVTRDVVLQQLDAVMDRAGIESFKEAVIAYEPVWAIGTGNTATPDQAQEVHGLIREHIAQADSKISAGVRIIYGGSVNTGNAASLFGQPDIDGGLVGGASLKAQEFISICSVEE